MARDYLTAALLAAAVLALTALSHPAIRRSLTAGFACLSRYPEIWRTPAFLGLAYALFEIAATLLLFARADDNLLAWIRAIDRAPLPSPEELLRLTWLPAAETSIVTFHFFFLTFPVSALLALRFLFNVDGVYGQLHRALRRRVPDAWLWIDLGLILTALAAIAKPFVYLFLPEIIALVPDPWIFSAAVLVNLAAYPFELLLGVFFLIYFSLMTSSWLRGAEIDRVTLVQLTVRRLARFTHWSLVILAVSIALVIAPTLIGVALPITESSASVARRFATGFGQPVFTGFLLASALVPITLVFHNVPLATAVRFAGRVLFQQSPVILLFLAFALTGGIVLKSPAQFAEVAFGPASALSLAVQTATTTAQGAFAGLLIAAWVCLYKSLTHRRKEVLF